MAGWIYDSNGVLNDDRIRNAVIENHRRETAAITATARAVEAATASFRHSANLDYSSLVSSIKGNRERSAELTASTEIISDNTEAISRARTQYGKLYRADQWQSPRDEPNHSQQRRSIGENLNDTAFSLGRSSQSSTEFARNLRDIEKNIVQM
ncbi:mobilization protein, partial [Acinetobacter guillouiae]